MHKEANWKTPVTYFRSDWCFEKLDCEISRLLQIQKKVKCSKFAKTENDTEMHPFLD